MNTEIEALKAANIAVWDVLQSCVRAGSLDSAIQRDSRVANDFAAFFKAHSNLTLIVFNGAEAEQSFRKYVLPRVELHSINMLRLPSTSPAHAIPLQLKLERWRAALLDRDEKFLSAR